MIIRALALLFTLCCFLEAFSQRSEADSLESLVRSVPADTTKVWLLNSLAAHLRERDNNKALVYAKEAKDLAELLNYRNGLGYAWENLGWILFRKGYFTKSYEAITQAMTISEEIGNASLKASCLVDLGAIHYEQNQNGEAIGHYKKAMEVSLANDDERLIARSFNNLAFVFLKLSLIDSARIFAIECMKHSNLAKDPYMIAFSERTMGDVYFSEQDYVRAEQHFKKCLDVALRNDITFLKLAALHRLGKLHSVVGQYNEALEYFFEDMSLAREYGYEDELERTYKLVAQTYELKRDIPNAFLYQSKYISAHDSLATQRKSEEISLAQSRFESEMKEAKIQFLTKEAALRQGEMNKQKLWLYFAVGCGTLLIILSVVLLINNRYAKIARKELEEKNLAISEQALELRNLNLTKDKLFSIISHDLRSPVAGLKSLMDLIDTPGLSQEEFVKITKVLKRNLDYVHEDLDNLLMWAQTQLQGMQALQEPVRLKLLAEEKISLFKDAALLKKISINNEISADAIVYADRNHVSLVLRNLIGNAIKFNQPGGCIKIASKQKGAEYEISVSDSGVGILDADMSKLFRAETHFTRPGTNKEKGLGIGLLLTKEFVEINRGSIWVESEEGKGTTFTFTLQANTPMMIA